MTMGNNVTGQHAYITWAWSGGTVILSNDFRSISIKETIDTADTTAGSDAYKTFIPTVKSATIDFSGLMAEGGSVLTYCAPGLQGTLTVAPEGTASGKKIKTYPAICMGPTLDTPYSDVVAVNVTFMSNGAWS